MSEPAQRASQSLRCIAAGESDSDFRSEISKEIFRFLTCILRDHRVVRTAVVLGTGRTLGIYALRVQICRYEGRNYRSRYHDSSMHDCVAVGLHGTTPGAITPSLE